MSENLWPLNEVSKIQVSSDIYIEFDQGDAWISICDEDWTWYDRGGAVVVKTENIDELISKLQEAKQLIEAEALEKIE